MPFESNEQAYSNRSNHIKTSNKTDRQQTRNPVTTSLTNNYSGHPLKWVNKQTHPVWSVNLRTLQHQVEVGHGIERTLPRDVLRVAAQVLGETERDVVAGLPDPGEAEHVMRKKSGTWLQKISTKKLYGKALQDEQAFSKWDEMCSVNKAFSLTLSLNLRFLYNTWGLP